MINGVCGFMFAVPYFNTTILVSDQSHKHFNMFLFGRNVSRCISFVVLKIYVQVRNFVKQLKHVVVSVIRGDVKRC